MSSSHSSSHGSHAEKLGVYLAIFAALMILTVVTVLAAGWELGAFTDVVALGIATIKASLVILYFMHVRHSTRLVKLFAVAGFFWLILMFLFTLADYMSRGWLGPLGK